jgi:hypothetical protein
VKEVIGDDQLDLETDPIAVCLNILRQDLIH